MIVLSRGSGVIGAAIRWQTRGEYSHVGWMRGDGSMIEAWHIGGVQHNRTPFALHGADATFDFFTMRCLTGGQIAAIEAFLLKQVGAGYDYLAIPRFMSRINRNNYNRWFCSELVAEACEMAGRPLLNTDGYRISPALLSWSTELVPVKMNAGLGWWAGKFEMGGKN